MERLVPNGLMAALHELLDGALELEAGERKAFLARPRLDRPGIAAELEQPGSTIPQSPDFSMPASPRAGSPTSCSST